MGFQIADDAASVSERTSSEKGFIDADLPLLQMLRIVEKKRGVIGVNHNLVDEPSNIRDFLTWASGSKKTPLPPLARRILCLKRAIIKNSIASVGTSLQQRTGEKNQLEEIDALLKADGVKNLDNAESCATEGSQWVPPAVGGDEPAAAVTKPTTSGCSTTVNCDNSALTALLTEIKESIGKIGGVTPTVDLTEIKAAIKAINDKIDTLGSSSKPAEGKFKVGDVVSRIDNEPLTSENACKKGKVIGFEEGESGDQNVRIECIEGPSAPSFTPENDPTLTPLRGGYRRQRGGVASIKELSPKVSLYKSNDIVLANAVVESGPKRNCRFKIGDRVFETNELIGDRTGTVVAYEPLTEEQQEKVKALSPVAPFEDTECKINVKWDSGVEEIVLPTNVTLLDTYMLGKFTEMKETSSNNLIGKLEALAPLLTELKPILEKLSSKEDIAAQFTELKQLIADQTSKTIEPLLKELKEWKDSGFQTSIQSITDKLEELRPALEQIPTLKTLLDDIKADILSGGKTLFNKLAALQKVLETHVSENAPKLAIENTADPKTVGALNDLTPIIDSITALRELITNVSSIKIEDVKTLLDSYKIGDTQTTLTKLQSMVESTTIELGTIKAKLDELKPHIDEIPALKTLVGSIQESITKGADVSSQLSGLQTMLSSYKLDAAVPLLEEITTWLKGNTIETQLEDVKESLAVVISQLYQDPADAIKSVQAAVDAVLPKLELINTSLTEQLSAIMNDTTAIKAGVEGLSTNTKTRDEELLAKIAEQTSMIAEMKQNIGELGSTLKETTTATFEDTESIKRRLHRLKNLIKVTHTPETEEAAVERVLQTYNSKLSEKIAGLQATNKQGKNNASLARVAELEALVTGLQARLQEENEHKVSVRNKEARIEELEEQISTLQSNSAKKNGRVSELTLQTADRQAQIEAKTAEIAQVRQEIADLTTNYEGQLREAAAAAEQLTREIRALQEAAEATATQLAEKERTSAAGVKAEANAKNLILNEQEESINRLRAEGKETNRLLTEAKASLAEITSAKTALEEELRVADGQTEQCSEALREALRSKNEELAARNLAYTEMVKQLNEERDATVASLMAAANTSNLDAAANALIKAKDAEVQEYILEKKEDAAVIENLTGLVQRLEREKAEGNTTLVQEKAAVEADLARSRSELESKNSRIGELEQELEQLRSGKKVSDAELIAVKTRLAELEAQLETVKGRVGTIKQTESARADQCEKDLKQARTPPPLNAHPERNPFYTPNSVATPSRLQLNPRKTVIDANALSGKSTVTYTPYQGSVQASNPIELDARSWQDSLHRTAPTSSSVVGQPRWRGGNKTQRSKKINSRRTRKAQ